MGAIRAVLDEEVDYGFEGGPEYLNEVTDLENGFEVVETAWAYSKSKFNASFGNIKDDVKEYFIEVFHACRGRRHWFMFKDWNDYIATDKPLQVEPGTTNTVQLYKTYFFANAFTVRPIQALKFASIKSPGGAIVAGTFNLFTGEFTPDDEWGSGDYTWSGEFYVWVRFDADYNSMTISNWRNNTTKVELVEKRLDITATNVPDSWEE